ncbi:MAG TPA: nuclear transport factor 2 family protein [Gemmatimonadales bacterium]|jgi:ketosteroid isomerase-like protein
MRTRYLAVAVLLLAACKPPAETDEAANARMSAEADSVKTGVTMMDNAFASAMVAGNVDGMVANYADNATVMPPNMGPIHGKVAIKAGFTAMVSQGKPSRFVLSPGEVSANGPMAVVRGRYDWTGPGPNGVMASDSGSYLEHWHKMGGSWKLVDDIWASDLPPMPMAPAAPAARHRS